MSKSIKIFVGLGGFGSSVVQKLYKRTTEKAGVTQPPSHLKFVTYDWLMYEKNDSDEGLLNTFGITEMASEAAQDYLDRKKKSLSDLSIWWPGIAKEKDKKTRWQLPPYEMNNQSRPLGRLSFMYHIEKQTNNLIENIKREYFDAINKNKLNESNIDVRIILVNSLAGITGSSSFLDVAHLLKSQLDRSSVSNFQLMLFTVTGDAAMHKRTEFQNPSYKLALSNTYAALTELDFWMDFDPSKNDTMEFPKYGKVERKAPLFNQCNIICLDNQNGRTLQHWSSYVDYVTNLLDVLEIKSETAGSFNSIYDNFLTLAAIADSPYASMATGAIYYPYRDALEYVYSYLAEEVLNDLVFEVDKSQVKKDLEKDLESLGLAEEGYFFEGTSRINQHRKDRIFERLEAPWTDEFGEKHPHPVVSLGLLEQKLNLENVQSVVKNIESHKKDLQRFYNFSKIEVYNSIIWGLKATLHHSDPGPSLSYMREYLKELKVIIDGRIKGLENYIPEIFEEKEYTSARDSYVVEKADLERKTKRRNLPDFRSATEEYIWAMKLVEKSKAKRDIYEKLSLQLEWYLKAVEELQAPLESSVLKHYKIIRSGLEQGTYSNYEREDFNIEALSVQEYKQEYRQYYEQLVTDKPKEIDRIKSNVKNQVLHLLSTDRKGGSGKKTDRIGNLELWAKYTITPQWSGQSSDQSTRVQFIDRDDQVRLKDHMRQLFDSIMEDEFKEMTTGILPKNVVEALYKEGKILSRDRKRPKRLSTLLKEKLNQLESLVTPFVVLNRDCKIGYEKMLSIETSDIAHLFSTYENDEYLEKDADEIGGVLNYNRKTLKAEYNKPAHSDHIAMIKFFGGFKLQHLVPYEEKYKFAYDNSNIEHFTSLRIKNKLFPES